MHDPFVFTASGARFYLNRPDASMIRLDDISHSLASIIRYCGSHAHRTPVAVHSIIVADILRAEHPDAVRQTPELLLAALLHDAAECYMGDVPAPLKRILPSYAHIENNVMAVVEEAFELPRGIMNHPALRAADKEALRHEVSANVLSYREAAMKNASAGRMNEAATAEAMVANLRPVDYGLPDGTEWLEAHDVHPDAGNMDAQAGPHASMLWVLRFEAEVRRLENVAPRSPAIVRAHSMMEEARTRSLRWRPLSSSRLFGLAYTEAPVPEQLKLPAAKAAIAAACATTGDVPDDKLRVAGDDAALAIVRFAKKFLEAMSADNLRGGLDPELVKTDPARAALQAMEEDAESRLMGLLRTAPTTETRH
jgi:5'-deoxynucleotidase YfbR-like HD superfamily hydrolase